MEEVFINVKGLAIEDLFKKDIVSVDDLVAELEDKMFENEELQEKIKDMESDDYEFSEFDR